MKKQICIQVEGLEKRYGGKVILEDVGFSVSEGEILSVIGPNGAGKSTLIRIILGLEEPSRGKVLVYGAPPRESRTRMGYVPQRFSFNREIPMTVEEFWSVTAGEAGNRTNYLDTVGLGYARGRELRQLSGGELQRLMVARALGTEKEIVILDEPAAGIDVSGQQTLYELIHRMHHEGKTVIIVSHELDVVFRHATSVLCLNRRALCHGEPTEAINDRVLRKLYGNHTAHYRHGKAHEPAK